MNQKVEELQYYQENSVVENDSYSSSDRRKQEQSELNKTISCIFTIILGLGALFVVVLQMEAMYFFPKWLFVGSLIIVGLELITITIALIASMAKSGSFWTMWIMSDMVEFLVRIAVYLIKLAIEIILKN